MKKSKKARFFKGDIVRKGKNEYKVEEIQHDERSSSLSLPRAMESGSLIRMKAIFLWR